MTEALQKLTVSYGALTCILEGFKDPFPVLKIVVDYFQVLTSRDHGFGSQPRRPDSEILRNLAQSGSAQNVEIETGEGGVILRQTARPAETGAAAAPARAANLVPVPRPGQLDSQASAIADALPGRNGPRNGTSEMAPSALYPFPADNESFGPARAAAGSDDGIDREERALDRLLGLARMRLGTDETLAPGNPLARLKLSLQEEMAASAFDDAGPSEALPDTDFVAEFLAPEPVAETAAMAAPVAPVMAQDEGPLATSAEIGQVTADAGDRADISPTPAATAAAGTGTPGQDAEILFVSTDLEYVEFDWIDTKAAARPMDMLVLGPALMVAAGTDLAAAAKLAQPVAEMSAEDMGRQLRLSRQRPAVGDFDYNAAERNAGPQSAPATGDPLPSRAMSEDTDEAHESDDTALSLDNFARKVGAASLPELLEASAAYVTIIVGRPRFSRASILNMVDELGDEGSYTQEARIKSFGKLLRNGSILRVADGKFAISNAAKFTYEVKISA